MLNDWNPKEPSNSFRRFAEDLKEESKRVFIQDGFHTELFFLISANGQSYMIKPHPAVDRDAIAAELRRRVRAEGSFGVVHICESWMYIPKTRADHTMKQLLQGEIAVSELRPGDRTEALVVTVESRDRWQMMWMSAIRRDGDKVSLAPTVEFDEGAGGRFVGLFSAR